MSASLFDREFYRASGKANWGSFVSRQAGVLFLAAVGAAVMYLVGRYIFHLVVIMPLVAGGILGALGQSVVEKSQCRNRWIAAASGLVAGCLLFFGIYYVEWIAFVGVRGWTRIDVIPDLIQWHIENDTIGPMHLHQQNNTSVGGNLFFFVLEFLCVVGPASILPFKSAGKLYCETCGKWCHSLSTTIAFDAAPPIVAAIGSREWSGVPECPTIDADIAKKKGPPCTLVTLEHCPDAPETGCPLYVSLRRYPKDAGPDRVRIKRLQIDQLEALRLMQKIPGLRDVDAAVAADEAPVVPVIGSPQSE